MAGKVMLALDEIIAARDNPERYIDALAFALGACDSLEIALAVADHEYEHGMLHAQWPEQEEPELSVDASGHEHKGKGPGGGEFAPKSHAEMMEKLGVKGKPVARAPAKAPEPLTELSDQQRNAIRQAIADDLYADQRNTRPMQKLADVAAKGGVSGRGKQAIAHAVTELATDKYNPPHLHDIFEAARKVDPAMTIDGFQSAIAQLAEQGAIELRPYTRAIGQLEYPEFVIPAGGEVLAYARPVGGAAMSLDEQAAESLVASPAEFAHDIANRAGQGILNRALEAGAKIGKEARNRIAAALDLPTAARQVQAILKIIHDYRIQFANLLGTTQLASLLEGMREVAGKLPPLPPPGTAAPAPPSLSPQEAKRTVDRLKPLGRVEREAAIERLPVEHQAYIRKALAAAGGGIPPQEPAVPEFPAGDPGKAQWPILDEAVRELASKNVVQRQDYDRMDYAARQKAFTVAGVDSAETLTKIRDALAENVRTAVDQDEWRKKLVDEGIEGTFLNDGHLTTVYRAAVNTALSDGQLAVLNHPMVKTGFPFCMTTSIADDRRRPWHGQVDKSGIDGTAIYLSSDPVFLKYRGPFDFGCRCGWLALSVQQAAEKGIEYAQRWLRDGVQPPDPPYVKDPDIYITPGFKREGVPLSIQLAMDLPIEFAWTGDGNLATTFKEVPQEFDYDCAAALAMSIGQYFGVGPKTLAEWRNHLGTNVKTSTDPKRWADYMASLGLSVESRHGMSIADLKAATEAGKPVACMIQEYGKPSKQASYKYGHWVGTLDVTEDGIDIADPSIENILRGEDSDQKRGQSLIGQDKWMEVWHDQDAQGNEYRQFGIIVGPPGGATEQIKPESSSITYNEDPSGDYWRDETTGEQWSATPAEMGMVGNEWHGPFPPGDDWVEIRVGPRGGKVWQKQGGAAPTEADHAAARQMAEQDYKANGIKAASFKAWFGDWEDEPAQASKVVNAEGQPQETFSIPETGSRVVKEGKPVVVYHGTAKGGFTRFDKSKLDPQALFGAGFYFTEDEGIANEYQDKENTKWELTLPVKEAAEQARRHLDKQLQQGAISEDDHWKSINSLNTASRDRKDLANYLAKVSEDKGWIKLAEVNKEVKAVFLSIKKPFDIDKDRLTAKQLGLKRFFADEVKSWDGTPKEKATADTPLSFEDWQAYGHATGDIGEVDEHGESVKGIANTINKKLQAMGYDGLTHIGGKNIGTKDHRVWIAFEPNQIKSVANRGTFDMGSDDINLSTVWAPYGESRGGMPRWKNATTGEVRYQTNAPDEQHAAAPEQPGQPRQPAHEDPDDPAKGGMGQAPKILDSLGSAGRWLRDRTKVIYGKLESRYGRKTALAIFASGQAIAWGAAAAGAAAGTPVWIPSAVAMAPGAALAEIVRQAKKLKGPVPEPPGAAQPSAETTIPQEGQNPKPTPEGEKSYVDQAMVNLAKTSRTASGVVDTSASKEKAGKTAEGLTGDVAAENAKKNFASVVRSLYYKAHDDSLKTPEGVAKTIDEVNAAINRGITKEGTLLRTDDSDKYPYTKVADLPLARKQFAEEFTKRLNDPEADPIETAAWAEWRINADHAYSDGCGKTQRAMAAIPLMKQGIPLPTYDDNKKFFAFFPKTPYDPKKGPETYTDEHFQKFLRFYKGQIPAQHSKVVRGLESKEYPAANPSGADSHDRHQLNGQWTPQRQKLHAEIINKIRGHVAPAPPGEKSYLMLGGGPASGKSSIIHQGLVTLPEHHVLLDSDAIKGELPEYKSLLGDKDERAANYAHEESSHIAKTATKQTLESGQHCVLDGTGDSSYEAVEKKVAQARKAGYKVNAEYVTCSTEEAVKRNIERAKKTGRLPPENMLRSVHRGVSEILPKAVEKGLFDNVRLWDMENQTDGKPALVMTSERGKTTIHRPDLWEKFVAKAHEGQPKKEAAPLSIVQWDSDAAELLAMDEAEEMALSLIEQSATEEMAEMLCGV
jgi:predicted ABC-type ATPase